MIFFYEMLFVAVAVVAVLIGEAWSRTAALLFLLAWWAISALGYASFGARLAHADAAGDGGGGSGGSGSGLAESGLADEERRWYLDARDGLRHLRLLFGLASGAALVWRIVAG